MIDFVHMVFGLAVAYLFDFPVVWAMLGAVFPDIDILMDLGGVLSHRGVLHTPLAAGVTMAALYLVSDRETVAYGFGLGVLTHLFLDTFTFSGIMWLYPLNTVSYSLELVAYDSVLVNVGVVVFSTLIVLGYHYQAEVLRWIR